MEKHLSRKTALGVAQLVLGLCGTVLLLYIPVAVACKEGTPIAVIMVRFTDRQCSLFCRVAVVEVTTLKWVKPM